jgi:hypothetical protein
MRLAAVLVFLALGAACSDGGPTAPTLPPPNGPRTGVWMGELLDSAHGTGIMRLDVGERVVDGTGAINGTWAMTFADVQRNAGGMVTGLVMGTQMTGLGTTQPVPTCPPAPFSSPGSLSIAATVSATEMVGTYLYSVCTTSRSGTLALRRQ